MDQLTQIIPVAEAVKILRNHQISPTQQRVVVAQALFIRDQHLSADQVLDLVHMHGFRVSKATIYNTLGLFARKGLVKERVVDPSKVYYDTNVNPHQHFYNEDTGELIDIEHELPQLQFEHLPVGTRVDNVDVIVRLRNQ